jgi:hypothetical protein
LNAIYSGPFVTLAKADFSNSQNANIPEMERVHQGQRKPAGLSGAGAGVG